MRLVSFALSMAITTSAFALDRNYPMAKSENSIEAQGTYYFGPETSENLACSLAEERAKEAAILKKVGEIVELMEVQTCRNEDCETSREFANTLTGAIRKIISRKIEKIIEQGKSSCIVTIQAEVDEVRNQTVFYIQNESFQFKNNENIQFVGVANRKGKLIVFHQSDTVYTKFYETTVNKVGSQFKIPNNGKKIIAKLPDGKDLSKERLMFLFLEVDIPVKQVYTHNEIQKFVENVPVLQRRVVYHSTQIVR